MLYYLLVAIYVIVCLLLILVVLLQQGRGGDLASAFGGGGSSQTAFGARQGATVLTRASTILGAMFMLGALALAIVGRSGPSSVVGGMQGPAAPAQQTAPATTPAAPAGTPASTGRHRACSVTEPDPAARPTVTDARSAKAVALTGRRSRRRQWQDWQMRLTHSCEVGTGTSFRR